MFEKFVKGIQDRVAAAIAGARRPQQRPDFGDPLAEQIDWTPVKGGGTNFRTHTLVMVRPNRLRYKASLGANLFGSIFLLAGLAIMIGIAGFSSGLLTGDEDVEILSADFLFPFFFGLVFAAVGLGMLWHYRKPITFDRDSGYFWKGRKNPALALPAERDISGTRLDDVHAIQIISERCRTKNSSYRSYELNLVLHDGRRENVIDHGKAVVIRRDAEQLGEFLRVPVWDITCPVDPVGTPDNAGQ